jgi:PAS domain-containing protein
MFDMVEIFDCPECKRIWANKAAIAASGLSRKRFFSTPCHKIWWRRDTPCDPCPNRWVMETGKPYQSQARTPDGKWWHFRCSPIWDESKTLIGVVQVSCNITDNKRAQQALATSEARFRFIFNSAPVGICHYNPKGIITECNPQFAKIAGTPPGAAYRL